MNSKTVEIFVNKWIKKEGARNYTAIITKAAQYGDEGENDDILEHAFEIFNKPEEWLTETEIQILGDYHRNFPSLSVADFVKITDSNNVSECFECAGIGWKEIDSIPVGREKELN